MATTAPAKRRARGDGSLTTYDTQQGTRWAFTATVPDPATGKGRQVRRGGFTSRAQAAKALRALQAEVDSGTAVVPSTLTLRTYLEDRWLPARGTQVRPSTLHSYSRNLRLHALPHLGDVPLQRLDAGRLDALYAHLLREGRADQQAGSGLSSRSVAYLHTILGAALRDAVKWGLLARNPVSAATKPKAAKKPDMTTWDAPTLRSFLQAASGDRLHPLWLLLATTGMRRGEALGLRWEDVDLDAGTVRLSRALVDLERGVPVWSDVKTAKGARRVSLDGHTVSVLRAHRAAVREDRLALGLTTLPTLMFTTPTYTPLHPERVSRTWRETVLRQDVPVIRLHDLRHTWACLALQAGVHPKVVQERLGHANIGVTMDTYSHVMPGMDAAAAETVSASIFGT